jgi:hypothetical protein
LVFSEYDAIKYLRYGACFGARPSSIASSFLAMVFSFVFIVNRTYQGHEHDPGPPAEALSL